MMLSDKSNLNHSTTATMSIPRNSENKENVRVATTLDHQQLQAVLYNEDIIESRQARNEQEWMEPLDYRQDWSQEIIDTFGTLQSCLHLEKVLIR